MKVFVTNVLQYFDFIFCLQDHIYVASFTSNTVSKVNKRTGDVAMVILVDDGTPVATEIYDPTLTLSVSRKHKVGILV